MPQVVYCLKFFIDVSHPFSGLSVHVRNEAETPVLILLSLYIVLFLLFLLPHHQRKHIFTCGEISILECVCRGVTAVRMSSRIFICMYVCSFTVQFPEIVQQALRGNVSKLLKQKQVLCDSRKRNLLRHSLNCEASSVRNMRMLFLQAILKR